VDGLERRSVSVLRIGFPGFAAVADQLDGPDATERLGDLLDLVTDAVLKHDGTVLMYDQAVVLAVWNAPHPQSNHARLALQGAEAGMRAAALAVKGSDLTVRGGLATGETLVGMAGSRIRRTVSSGTPAATDWPSRRGPGRRRAGCLTRVTPTRWCLPSERRSPLR